MKITKKIFSVILGFMLVIGFIPGMILDVRADDGSYAATLTADQAVNSQSLNLEMSFFAEAGGKGTNLGNQVVSISPSSGTYTNTNNGSIPQNTKSVKLTLQTAGNSVDFNNSNILLNGTAVNNIAGITGNLVLDITDSDTLSINIKVISANPSGGNPDPGNTGEQKSLTFQLSGDKDIIEEVVVSCDTEPNGKRINPATGKVDLASSENYTVKFIPYFGGTKIANVTVDGVACNIDAADGSASLTVAAKDTPYNVVVTKGGQSDDVTILWTYDPSEKTGGWADAYIDSSTGTVQFVSASRNGQAVNLNVDTNNGGYIQCKRGDVVTLKFIPKAGYQLSSASLNGQTLEAQAEQSTFKVTMNGNFHLAGAFSKTNPQIKVSESSNVSGLGVSGTDAALTTGNVAIGLEGGKTNPKNAAIQTAMGNDSSDFVSTVETVEITMTNIISKGGNGDYFSNEGNYWTNNMTDLTKPVSFSLSVPDKLSTSETYSIVRNHDGKLEELAATYSASTETLTFSSDKFSDYTIIKKKTASTSDKNSSSERKSSSSSSSSSSSDSKKSSSSGKNTTSSGQNTSTDKNTNNSSAVKSPKTGDPNELRIWCFFFLASLGWLGFLGYYKKKSIGK
uniref:Bacterial repeat domain-containing protein n=1 Tax=Eubacterium cellulosolvens (strain ATCC 43171 / JCM 9499 / 6) TaxID=633697 RepID=I5AT50_EUBC6